MRISVQRLTTIEILHKYQEVSKRTLELFVIPKKFISRKIFQNLNFDCREFVPFFGANICTIDDLETLNLSKINFTENVDNLKFDFIESPII